jgi:NAD(P)-dependent dehydrogenase (short-subunit alcohol dehydrogenase family)
MVERKTVARSVVITGASTGIGRSCALCLDQRGFRVFAGVRNREDGIALREQASEQLIPLILDVTDPESVAAATARVTQTVGADGLWGLVNNAGVAVVGPLELVPAMDLRRQFEVNMIGHVVVTQSFLPGLRSGRGRIINIGSVAGTVGFPFLGPYCASKAALRSLTDCLRMEIKPWGIHVAIVEPGAVATPIWEKSRKAGDERLSRSTKGVANLYAPALAGMRSITERRSRAGVAPDVVAQAVVHALTARSPKRHYTIGRDARLDFRLLRLLPERLRSWLILQQIGMRDAV